MKLKGLSKSIYNIDSSLLGSGGEGDVYKAYVPRAAKIYKPSVITPELESKLKVMIAHPPDEAVLTQVAWPLDIVYDENGRCKGFIMPELQINAELGEIYKYPSKLPISVFQKINIAQNICVVISDVHRAGYVFGDFNPRNIGLDTNTGLVSFLDTDTYHVADPLGNETYRCNVCAPGYAAPELLKKCADFITANPTASKHAYAQTPLPTFTRETDNFALAIHIFKLLMNGYTPFGGIIETASVSLSSPGVGDAAVRRDSYCFKEGYKHQSSAILPLEAFPQEIADMFTRAFVTGKTNPEVRPSAELWHGALTRLAQEMVTCGDNPLHQYYNKNTACPYCEADRKFAAALSGASQPTGAVLRQTTYSPPPKMQTPPSHSGKSVALGSAKVGDAIAFGEYDWMLLDVVGNRALILSEQIICQMPYHNKREDVTWEFCNIRHHLSGTYYLSFAASDRARIKAQRLDNHNNPWYATSGGWVTYDSIFC